MIIYFDAKNANATLNYAVNFDEHMVTGEVIANSAVLVPDPLVLIEQQHIGKTVIAQIGPGGSPGSHYVIEFHALTDTGLVYVETRVLPIDTPPPAVWSPDGPGTSIPVGDSPSGVTSFNNRVGHITLTTEDIVTALGYTPVVSGGGAPSSVGVFEHIVFDQSTFG